MDIISTIAGVSVIWCVLDAVFAIAFSKYHETVLVEYVSDENRKEHNKIAKILFGIKL